MPFYPETIDKIFSIFEFPFFQCPFCLKSFLSDEFLKAHILRRHADKTPDMSTFAPKSSVGQNGLRPSDSFNKQEELIKELGYISTKLQETEARLVAEREERDHKYKNASLMLQITFNYCPANVCICCLLGNHMKICYDVCVILGQGIGSSKN